MLDSWGKERKDGVVWVGVACGCVLKQEGKYLLVQERMAKAYGLWNLPAGWADEGETLEEAARREAKEETGYDVEVGERILVRHDTAKESVKHAFRGKIIGGELKFQKEELLDAKWLTFEEIKALQDTGKIRSPWIWEAIKAVEKNGQQT